MKYSNTDITIHAYNRNADKYANKFTNFESYKEKILLFQKNYIPRHSYILDIGCGPGNNAKILLEQDESHKITGIDLSAEMINIAKDIAPQCKFKVQDIREINPDQKYDAIIASFCIVHLSDNETNTLIPKISKMLKENGSLYLSYMEGNKSGFETTSFSDDDIYFNYFKRDDIIKLLSENSIETIEITSGSYQEQDGSITEDVFIFARKIIK